MVRWLILLAFWAGLAAADTIPAPAWVALRGAEVVVLGEVHDNPVHHDVQVRVVSDLQPKALVVEMLNPDQAGRLRGILAEDPGNAAHILGWDTSGWPDFEMYRPIFTNTPNARIFGADVPRDRARAALAEGIAQAFGPDAADFGLTEVLPEAQQAAREALQFEAHCDALPVEMLPGMVDLQRLRDAVMARAVLQALDQTGGPVAVITGNGHARRDWGMPAFLARMRPQTRVYSVGQGEDGVPPGGEFDLELDAPPVLRPDPCDAFR